MPITAPASRRLQHEAAREKADINRLKTAGLKPRIRRAEVLIVDILADPPAHIAPMWIGELLKLQRQWGDVKAHKFLESLDVSFDREVGKLTERQREALIAELPPQVTGYQKPIPNSSRQRTAARLKGNRVRRQRADLKGAIKSGTVSVNTALLNPPDYLQNAKLIDILMATPRIGKTKSRKILASCHVGAHRTVGSLTERERHRLVEWLRSWTTQLEVRRGTSSP